MPRVLFSTLVRSPEATFLGGINHIVLVGSKEKVLRIYTLWRVTFMKAVEPI